MKKLPLVLFALLIATPALADVWVKGYYRSDGTYVPGHWVSSPNDTTEDNYSTYPNYNPHNGKVGGRYPGPAPSTPYAPYQDYGSNPYPSSSGNDSSNKIEVPKLNAPVGSLDKDCPTRTSIYQPRCD